MSYSVISALALILNLIINHEALWHFKISSKASESEQRAVIRYSHFLTAANCYFITDMAWGVLYEHHDIPALFPFLYSDCIFYFIFMFLTMLTWVRYTVAYLDRKGLRSKIILCAVWSIFLLGLVYLMVNRFYPFIFSFNEKHEYIMESGRHIAFVLQIALYMLTSIYMFHIARKSSPGVRSRYIAVGATCFMMGLFLVLQILNPKYPSYSREFSSSKKYASMNVPVDGRDFYAETMLNIEKYVHPDDREFARSLYSKETMLKNLEGRKSYSYKYRVMLGGHPKYFQFTVMNAYDDRHFVLYEKDIDDEITAENMRLENQKKHVTFSQIAEILAVNYDVIYYVDAEDSSYISYECRNIYGRLDMQKSGDDFFMDSRNDIANIVHKNDRDIVFEFLCRDHIIGSLKTQKSCSIDYRILAFKKTHYVRMTVRKTADCTHYIIGIENIDDEVRKEKERLKELNAEKELARRDDLAGVKNKTAYNELEESVQANIDNGMDYLPFGLVVCDANNLKMINDKEGHAAGDEYIKKSAALLRDVFNHSPVFRVGGDEFVVFLRGDDYSNRTELMERFRARILENLKSGSGPVMASGMAEYVPEKDNLVSEIFDRADKKMYENKRKLKKKEATQD